MIVKVYLNETSQPIEYKNVNNTYQKGHMFCIYFNTMVHKYPIKKIWRIEETYSKDG